MRSTGTVSSSDNPVYTDEQRDIMRESEGDLSSWFGGDGML